MLVSNKEKGLELLEAHMNYEEPDELLKREEWIDGIAVNLAESGC